MRHPRRGKGKYIPLHASFGSLPAMSNLGICRRDHSLPASRGRSTWRGYRDRKLASERAEEQRTCRARALRDQLRERSAVSAAAGSTFGARPPPERDQRFRVSSDRLVELVKNGALTEVSLSAKRTKDECGGGACHSNARQSASSARYRFRPISWIRSSCF